MSDEECRNPEGRYPVRTGYAPMPDRPERLTPVTAEDIAVRSLSRCVITAAGASTTRMRSWPPTIVAKRLVEHLERSGFVVMKRPAEIGAAALGRGYEA